VLTFSNLADAMASFGDWSKDAGSVSTCFWSYQFPVAAPWSYWGAYHLARDSYRLDIERSPNEHGCYVYGQHIQEASGPTLTKHLYEELWSSVEKSVPESLADDRLRSILQEFPEAMDLLQACADDEDPACQMTVDDFVFLSGFQWLRQEAEFLRRARDRGVSINNSMLALMDRIVGSQMFMITMSKTVVVAPVDG
jgi:hypothetical protein